MKLGPLSLERGTASAYVAFGEAGLDVVVEADDEDGLVSLARRNKDEVLVCEPSLSRAAVRRGLSVAAPPPVALSMKAALAVNLDHGRALEDVSPELVLELIEATLEFNAAAPWRSFEPDEAIAIRIEPGGRELEGCVLGQAGEEFGLALYHQAGSIQKVIAFADEGRPEKARSLGATTMLIERGDAFVVDAIEEMAGVAAAPRVLHVARGNLSPATAHDVARLVGALRAVTAMTNRGADASGRSVGREWSVVAHATRVTASNRRASSNYDAVGRNELCPCGSGKKFKRCHLDAINELPSDSGRASIHVRDERVVRDVIAFGARRFGADAVARAAEQKFGTSGVAIQLMTPLVAYEIPFDGKSLAAHYLDAASKGASADDRRWIERQLQTRLSIWEVLSVDRGRGMEVVDLLWAPVLRRRELGLADTATSTRDSRSRRSRRAQRVLRDPRVAARAGGGRPRRAESAWDLARDWRVARGVARRARGVGAQGDDADDRSQHRWSRRRERRRCIRRRTRRVPARCSDTGCAGWRRRGRASCQERAPHVHATRKRGPSELDEHRDWNGPLDADPPRRDNELTRARRDSRE